MSHYAPGPTPPITASPSQPPLEDEDGGEDNIFRDMTFEEVLEDLNARFLVNLPEEEMSLVRVYWQAEQAHWFYEDYLRPLNPLLPSGNASSRTSSLPVRHCTPTLTSTMTPCGRSTARTRRWCRVAAVSSSTTRPTRSSWCAAGRAMPAGASPAARSTVKNQMCPAPFEK